MQCKISWMISFPVVWFIVVYHSPSAAFEPRTTRFSVPFNSRSYNGEIIQLQSSLNDEYNNFQEKSNLYLILKPIIGRLFQKIILGRSLHSALRRNAATLRKVLAPFPFSHVIDYSSFFSLPLSLSFFRVLVFFF